MFSPQFVCFHRLVGRKTFAIIPHLKHLPEIEQKAAILLTQAPALFFHFQTQNSENTDASCIRVIFRTFLYLTKCCV